MEGLAQDSLAEGDFPLLDHRVETGSDVIDWSAYIDQQLFDDLSQFGVSNAINHDSGLAIPSDLPVGRDGGEGQQPIGFVETPEENMWGFLSEVQTNNATNVGDHQYKYESKTSHQAPPPPENPRPSKRAKVVPTNEQTAYGNMITRWQVTPDQSQPYPMQSAGFQGRIKGIKMDQASTTQCDTQSTKLGSYKSEPRAGNDTLRKGGKENKGTGIKLHTGCDCKCATVDALKAQIKQLRADFKTAAKALSDVAKSLEKLDPDSA